MNGLEPNDDGFLSQSLYMRDISSYIFYLVARFHPALTPHNAQMTLTLKMTFHRLLLRSTPNPESRVTTPYLLKTTPRPPPLVTTCISDYPTNTSCAKSERPCTKTQAILFRSQSPHHQRCLHLETAVSTSTTIISTTIQAHGVSQKTQI